MPRSPSARTPRASSLPLPDDLKLGATLLAGLRSRELLAQVERWLPLSRRGGHGVVGLFALALTFLAAGRGWGIRPFATAFGGALNGLVAPRAGLRALPTAAAMSRALGRMRHGDVRAFLDRLLSSDADTRTLIACPHVRHRDALGVGWHVLDFDPTVEAFRQRGLPEDPSMPAPGRISPGTPGYTGHKRGELRIRHLPLQHAGSGAWLGYRLDATGDSLLPLLSEVLAVGRATLDAVSPGATVVRADGEFGSVGAMRTCLASQVHVLTRLCRYALLDREDVLARMATAAWAKVSGSGGGPEREATNLGLFTLYPDVGSHEADGGPVEVRVVVSRFRREGPPDHGVLRDGFQLELFATSLPSDAWPAEDVVTLYFGRSAMESRFSQEDREIGIDRTFSYHPPGQEWMSGLGLFLWNVLVGRGAAVAPLPPELPAQEVRPTHDRTREQPPPPATPLGAEDPLRENPECLDDAPASTEPEPEPAHEPPDEEGGLRGELWSFASDAFARLPPPDGWRVDDERQEVRCPNGERLRVYAIESAQRPLVGGRERGKHRIMVRTDMRACNGCPLRAECTSSERANTYKQVTRSISEAEMLRGRELLQRLRKFSRKDQLRRIHARRELARGGDEKPVVPPRPLRTPDEGGAPGPLAPSPALFLPAASRRLVRDLIRRIPVEVAVTARRHAAVLAHPLLAPSTNIRRRQRLTWVERAARWNFGGQVLLHLGGMRGLAPSERAQIKASLAL
jgi:hypothetical protein